MACNLSAVLKTQGRHPCSGDSMETVKCMDKHTSYGQGAWLSSPQRSRLWQLYGRNCPLSRTYPQANLVEKAIGIFWIAWNIMKGVHTTAGSWTARSSKSVWLLFTSFQGARSDAGCTISSLIQGWCLEHSERNFFGIHHWFPKFLGADSFLGCYLKQQQNSLNAHKIWVEFPALL